MSPARAIEVARRYVALSNEGALDGALAMFAEGAVYVSTQVGSYEGREAIGTMMRAFFTRCERPHWDVAEYRAVSDGEAEFGFVMTAADPEAGTTIERRGVERIAVDADGRIRHVTVHVRA